MNDPILRIYNPNDKLTIQYHVWEDTIIDLANDMRAVGEYCGVHDIKCATEPLNLIPHHLFDPACKTKEGQITVIFQLTDTSIKLKEFMLETTKYQGEIIATGIREVKV